MLHQFDPSKPESLRDLRVRLKISQTVAAARAGMAPNTYRVYELERSGVSPENQAKGDAFAASLRAIAAGVAA